MFEPAARWGDDPVARRLAPLLLRLRTYVYGAVAALMLVASIAGRLERLVALAAFALAFVVPWFARRLDDVRRIELAIVADLTGAFVIWWSLQQAPIVTLLLVIWAVAVTSTLEDARTSGALLLFAVVLEVLKLPISLLQGSGVLPVNVSGGPGVETFSLVLSAGGGSVIVIASAMVLRGVWRVQRTTVDRADASEARLESMLSSRIAALAVIGGDGRIVEINDDGAALLRQSQDAIVGTRWTELLDPMVREDLTRFGRKAFVSGHGSLRREVRLEPPDGRTRWVDLRLEYLPATGSDSPVFWAHLDDVTDRRAAEAALLRSETQYRTFFEGLPVAMYRSRIRGEIVDGNQALADLLGYDDPIELKGINASDFYVDPSDRDRLHGFMERAGFVVGHEYRIRRTDGSIIWVRDSARVFGEGDDAVFEGAIVDITEQRTAETQLAARARQQEAIALLGRLALEHPDIAVAIHRSADIMTEVLDARGAYVVERRPDGKLVLAASGETDVIALPPGVRRIADEAIQRSLDGEPSHALGPGGCAVVIPGPREPFGALVAIDSPSRTFGVLEVTFIQAVTGVLGAAIERSRARTRLEELVASKDEFIASISHEVRTPLTVVAGMADELYAGWEDFDRDEIQELIAMMVDQSREMQDLVEDLLVAARADIGKVAVDMQQIDVRREVDHVVRSLAATREREIALPDVDAGAYADPVRFRQIVRNLVTNAIRYGGETIEIEIEPGRGQVAIRVRDDGRGIPYSERDRVFLPYERAHRTPTQPGSVGLGLSVARKLAELMGGDLTYRYDEGSVFELTLVKAVEIGPIESGENTE